MAAQYPDRVDGDETHLSTKQSETGTYPRFPGTDGDQVRAQDHQCPTCQGSRAPGSLSEHISQTESGGAGDGKPSRAFSRARRLLRADDYGRVFKTAERSSDRYFTVLARTRQKPAGKSGTSRLGLAIAKKQLRRAVDRNRIKRLVREYFRTEVLPTELKARDYVVMARSASKSASNAALRASLANHFRRLRAR